MTKTLDRFQQWMVRKNLEYAEIEGIAAVLIRLRSQGYLLVADAVEAAYRAKHPE
jgi:hypothetical protein